MKETLRHKEAFEYYYSLGHDRSLISVALQCGVSERSVAAWSKAFDWQARVEQRDLENAKRLQQKTDETVVAVKARYRKVIGAAIGDFVSRLKAGKIVDLSCTFCQARGILILYVYLGSCYKHNNLSRGWFLVDDVTEGPASTFRSGIERE